MGNGTFFPSFQQAGNGFSAVDFQAATCVSIDSKNDAQCCQVVVQGMAWLVWSDMVAFVLLFQNPKQLGMAFSVGYFAANEASNDSKCTSKILFQRSTKQGMVDSMDKVYLGHISSKLAWIHVLHGNGLCKHILNDISELFQLAPSVKNA